jgi:hypothetical protein
MRFLRLSFRKGRAVERFGISGLKAEIEELGIRVGTRHAAK